MKPNWTKVLVLAGLAALCLTACRPDKTTNPDEHPGNINGNDSGRAQARNNEQKQLSENNNYPLIKYSRFFVADIKVLDSLKKTLNDSANKDLFNVVRLLNRKYINYIHVHDTILVPDQYSRDLRAYSIFPLHYPAADSIPKLIVVSNTYQSYGAYEHGRLVRFVPVNTGKKNDPLRAGLYHLMWKDKNHRSSINHDWVMPFTFNISRHGNAFHQYKMPGYPASHGCVRQFMEDANWLYYWGQEWKKDSTGRINDNSGTPVLVLDNYDFSKGTKGPWHYLYSNKDFVLILPGDPLSAKKKK
jgi:lipoprotein-anchoring transpeptidase ErfK/SrfK